MKKTAIVLASLSLVLAGCGASDEEQATTNIKDSIVEDGSFLVGEAGLDVSESDATCVSEGLVEGVGVADLQEAGVLQDDLTVEGDVAGADFGAEDSAAKDEVLADCLGDEIAKANIKASILEDENIAGAVVTEEDATCLSDGFVEKVGTDKLQEYNILDDQLAVQDDVGEVSMESGDADAMAEVFVECVDAEKMFDDRFSEMTANMTQEQVACIQEIVDEEKVKEIMSATFQGDVADMQSSLQQDFMKCVRP